jgi:hypothetical protein
VPVRQRYFLPGAFHIFRFYKRKPFNSVLKMPIVKFTGRVLPDVMLVTITDHPAIDWYDADVGINCSFKISIQHGVIEIDCILDKYQDSDLARVYMRAFDLARATVDLTCFSTGYGLTVILDRYTNPSGITTPIALMMLDSPRYAPHLQWSLQPRLKRMNSTRF